MSDARGLAGYPHWLLDIDATLPVTAQYVLHGNVRDRHLLPGAVPGEPPRLMSTVSSLWETLRASDFDAVLYHAPQEVLRVWAHAGDEALGRVRQLLDGCAASLDSPATYDALADVLRRVAGSREARVAIVLDYVSRSSPDGEPPSDELHQLMLVALSQVHSGHGHRREGARRGAIYNPVLWLVEVPADLPGWLVSGSDGVRQVPLPVPDLDTRTAAAAALAPHLPRADPQRLPEGGPPTEPDSDVVRRFAQCTEGMTLRGMMEVVSLAVDAQVEGKRVEDSVQAYRLGLLDNPWRRPMLRRRIVDGRETLEGRVMGQPRAVRHALDILVRSSMGLTAAHRSGPSTGPRGVMFFAGPTGVGKTELAKAITELVFGDERAYIRFDMSEFSSEQSEARLIGSPPGFVGHGSGGELTNAVRRRPFSVLLFDEIEKAHPRILDKFLQILSDGRLTDGTGDTVHFSETIIVFTSNLGIRGAEGQGTTAAEQSISFEQQVKANVEREFREQLNRPELLGRIGDNIVVFDYLSREVGDSLLRGLLPRVIERVRREHGIEVAFGPGVEDRLVEVCTRDLSLGGRGVIDALESVLVNPLARALARPDGGTTLTVSDLRETDGDPEVVLA